MTTRTEPLTVAQAQAALEEAEAALDALHDKLTAGDGGVSQRAYADASAGVAFAQARLEAAERAAAERAADERAQALEAIRRRLADDFDPAEIERLGDALEAALEAYVAAAEDWNARLATLRDELQARGFSADRDVELYRADGSRPGLRIGSTAQAQWPPKPRIDAAIQTVMRRYFPRGY